MPDCPDCDSKRLDESMKRKDPGAKPDWHSRKDGGYGAVAPAGRPAAAAPAERFQPTGFEMRRERRVIREGAEVQNG